MSASSKTIKNKKKLYFQTIFIIDLEIDFELLTTSNNCAHLSYYLNNATILPLNFRLFKKCIQICRQFFKFQQFMKNDIPYP